MARDSQCLISEDVDGRSRENRKAGTVELVAGVVVKAGATAGTLEPVADGDDVVAGVVPELTAPGEPCVLINIDAQVKGAKLTYPTAHKAWVMAGLASLGIKVR